MELPICNGTYSNDCDVPDVVFLNDIKLFIDEFIESYREFFICLCNYCRVPGLPGQPINRCGGCQLVSYCSRDCQNKDRASHKHVCSEFPVINGDNALLTTGSWKEHIANPRDREARLPKAESASSSIFRNPRVCRTCREARQDRLTDCKCLCVSYCSRKCVKADTETVTTAFNVSYMHIAIVINMISRSLRDMSVCDKFTLASSWNEIIPPKSALPLAIAKIVGPFDSAMYLFFVTGVLSYPMSLLYALQTLSQRRLGLNHISIEDLTTLTIHVVIRTLGVLYASASKLNQLNVVFVMHGKAFKPSFNLNTGLSLLRCKDCKAKSRSITYSVHQMQYHMYFSSQEYTEPNVVVVFGNNYEMAANEVDSIYNEISYRNMTYSQDTVLVLMDVTKELVIQGVSAVNAVQPVDQLVVPQINPLSGSSLNRAELDADAELSNDKCYFTCLRRK